MDNSHHEKISPTAWATAYARTFTDIPYSKETFEWLENKRSSLGQEDLSVQMKETSLAILMEGRYKMIDKVLAEVGFDQILEIASGFCQRGYIMSADPSVTYVEMDLPGIMEEKQEMVRSFEKQVGTKRTNLFLEPGNSLSLDDMKRAVLHLDQKKPVAIVNEGLLRYLSIDEKTAVARNVHLLLKQFGGVWITPDVSLKRVVFNNDSLQRKKFNEFVQKSTGVNIMNNLFRDVQHAVDFFTELGFEVEQRSYAEVENQLTCPKILGLSEEEVKHSSKAVLLVMQVK